MVKVHQNWVQRVQWKNGQSVINKSPHVCNMSTGLHILRPGENKVIFDTLRSLSKVHFPMCSSFPPPDTLETPVPPHLFPRLSPPDSVNSLYVFADMIHRWKVLGTLFFQVSRSRSHLLYTPTYTQPSFMHCTGLLTSLLPKAFSLWPNIVLCIFAHACEEPCRNFERVVRTHTCIEIAAWAHPIFSPSM